MTKDEIEIYKDEDVRIFSAIFWNNKKDPEPPDNTQHTLLVTWGRSPRHTVFPFPDAVIKAYEELSKTNSRFTRIDEAKKRMGM